MKSWMLFIAGLSSNRRVKSIALTVYYLAILLGLIALYGKGDFSTPPFVYQEF